MDNIERPYEGSSKKTTHLLIETNQQEIKPASKNVVVNKGSLQMSLYALTTELINGNASGDFRTKDFVNIMNRILQKLSLTVQANFQDTNLSISNSRNDIGVLKVHIVDPACEWLLKITKSKYLFKIADHNNGFYIDKLANVVRKIIEIKNDVKDIDIQTHNTKILFAITDTFNYISRNEIIRHYLMKDTILNTIIDLFIWCMKQK